MAQEQQPSLFDLDNEIEVAVFDGGVVECLIEESQINELATGKTESVAPASVAVVSDFTHRNGHLIDAATEFSRAGSARGAQMSKGLGGTAFQGWSNGARGSENYHTNEAKKSVKLACGACALRDTCHLSQDRLIARLEKPTSESNYRTRLKKAATANKLEYCADIDVSRR
jgi:hypothetical protein